MCVCVCALHCTAERGAAHSVVRSVFVGASGWLAGAERLPVCAQRIEQGLGGFDAGPALTLVPGADAMPLWDSAGVASREEEGKRRKWKG